MKLQSNCFYGKREAGSGESKYLRCLLLEAEEWKSFEFWGSFKPTMYVLLITACILLCIYNIIHTIDLFQFSNYETECIFFISIGNIVMLVNAFVVSTIVDFRRNAYKKDIIHRHFWVVDVDVVEYKTRSGISGRVRIADSHGNLSKRKFITLEGNEVQKTKKGSIIIFKSDNGKEKVVYYLFPKYDKKNVFCSERKNKYKIWKTAANL